MDVQPVWFSALLLSLGSNTLAKSTKKPHILVVLADDLGWHDIGYHGAEIDTPVLDALAAEGVKLESHYMQPLCTASRSQLLSGRYQIHTGLQHGVIHSKVPNGLPLPLPTMADKLRESGYATHLVGKWHLGFYKTAYTPLHRGFDSFYGFYDGMEDYFTHRKGTGLDLRDNDDPVWENNEYSAHLFARKAIEVVARHNKSKPLFLYLSFQSVHRPMQVPPSYERKYKFIKDKERRTYAGMVAAMDEAIGNVTSAFKHYGLWDDTVMLFSTDNGGAMGNGASNYPLRGRKKDLFEGGVRAVSFVRGQLETTQGTSCHELIHVSDWFPTFLHLAGGSSNGTQLDGFNVWGAVSQNQKSPRTELLHNIDPRREPIGKNAYPEIYDVRVRSALRRGHWKILTGNPGWSKWMPHPPDAPAGYNRSMFQDFKPSIREHREKNVWLFNITADPYERRDLSDQYPEVVHQLLTRLAAYNESAVPCAYPPSDPEADPVKHGGVWGPWQDDERNGGQTINNTIPEFAYATGPTLESYKFITVSIEILTIAFFAWLVCKSFARGMCVRVS